MNNSICRLDYCSQRDFISLKRKILPHEFIVYGLIFSTSIDTTSFFNFHFGPLQVSLPDILLIALLYVIVAKLAIGSFSISVYSSKTAITLLMAAIFSLVSFLYLGSGRYAILDAKISLKFFEHAALIFAVGSLVNNVRVLCYSLRIFCISSVLLSVVTIMYSLGILNLGDGFTRKTTFELGPFLFGTAGISGEVMGVSILMIASFPFMISRFIFQSFVLRTLFVILSLISIAILFTRSAWISVFIEVILLSFIYIRQLKYRFFRSFFFVGILLLFVVLINNFDKLYSLIVNLRSSTVEGRLDGYVSALSMVFSDPVYILFGAGKGNFLLNQFYIGRSAFAHNFLIDILVSKGIVVLSIILYAFGNLILNLYRIKEDCFQTLKFLALISMTGVVVVSMFMPSINSIQLWIAFALSVSIVSVSRLCQPDLD